ncbi:MAG: recombinase family protein [Chloroflexota bacterium]|nr:recombinase family protein [Chloroflexota bacterium]
MIAIGYFRRSEDSPDSPTLAEQQNTFDHHCQQRGWQPAETFVDVDSGGYLGRTAYQRMRGYIRRNGQDTIVVVTTLGQLHPDLNELICRLIELDALGVQVMPIDEEAGSPLDMALDMWSRRRQAEKRGNAVREAMKLRAVRGKGLGKPPYGYRLGADKRLEVVPEEATVVQLIYKLYLDRNMGVRLIARHLNEQAITTRRGGLWSIVGIRDILRNRAYVGTSSRFGFRVPDSHKAIIDTDTFNRVQERLSSKTLRRGRAQKSLFLLSGLAYCGYCSNKMIGVNRTQTWTRSRKGGKKKGQYRYYQCQSRTNQSMCQYHTKRADELESAVLGMLRSCDNALALSQLAVVRDTAQEALERASLDKRLKTVDRKLGEHLDQAAEGALPQEELRSLGGDLIWERRLVERRMGILVGSAEDGISTGERQDYVLEMLDELRGPWDSLSIAQRKALLEHLVDRIVVHDDRVDVTIKL